ncbi:MAG: molybdopterin oxidoreductase [Chloroflexi bacterium RBG_16_51_9]|nr:MAG: molybdopterin oxidoreductase [Chloroflexi bacterium RBG_16_51_9]
METKEVMTDCTLCLHSCGIKVTVEDGKAVKVAGLKEHPLTNGELCPKGEAMLENIYSPERVKYPMKKVNGKFERISWEQALDEISAKLLDLKAKYGPEALAVFTGSVGVENLEMAGLAQRFSSAFGTPNFVSVESVCYRMRLRARQLTFGRPATEEYDSNLYVLWGHNPESSDLPLKIHMAENRRKGAKMVVIDPKRTMQADGADMYIRIRPGTDGALALAMMNVIVNEKLYDKEFVGKYTVGFEKLVSHIQQYTPEWAEKITGVKVEDIRKLARLFAGTKGASIFQGICSLDQTANGTQTSRAMAILQTITGNINVPGGWVISLRPSMGRVDMEVPKPLGNEKYPIISEMWGRKSPYGVVTMVPENIPQKIKAFFVIGGNPLVSMADSNAFREAFKKLELLVVHDLFMSETAQAANYVLPACSHLEKWGVAYTYNIDHCLPYLMLRKKAIELLGECCSEWKLVTELAGRLGLGSLFPWKSEEEMVAYELAPSGLSFDHLLTEKPEGAYYQKKKYGIEEKTFNTPSGKIEIYSLELEKVGADPLPTYTEPHKSPVSTTQLLGKYPLILCTGSRSLYYTHSQFRHVASLRKEDPEPLAELVAGTAEKYGVKTGDTVIIKTPSGRVKMKARVTDRVAEGVVLVPHGWSGEANANLLTDTNSREGVMGYPEMKALLCSVRKA